MTLPLDTTPLHDAVEHAISQNTGQPRAIPAAHLFALAPPTEGTGRSSVAKAKPVAWVDVVDESAAEPNMLEMSDRRRVGVRVVITCNYAAGQDAASRKAARAVVKRSTALLLAALCYPSALELDPDGNETGVDGGALRADQHASSGPPRQPLKSTDPHVMQVVHTFRTTVELRQPT